jgi:chromosomal replication initiator protein
LADRNATPLNPTDAIGRLEAAIVARIGAVRYELWFRKHTQFLWADRAVHVVVSSQHFKEWLPQAYGEVIDAAVAELFAPGTAVKYTVEPEAFTATAPKPAPRVNLFGETIEPEEPKAKRTAKVDALKPARRWKQLEDFVVGQNNRVAFAAAQSVVEEPGQGANPMVFHGPVGTGKTHLLEGIYSGLRKRYTDCRPVFLTAEEFTVRFTQACRFGKVSGFRKLVRECSALLVDDLHFLAKKAATQEEFLHTFDALVADGKQVVVTTDCHPKLAEEFIPELADRLAGGSAWGLMPPDGVTRYDILKVKTAASQPALPEDVLRYLARNLQGNVRELEGALNTVRHYSRVTGLVADVRSTREAIGDLLRHTIRSVTLADIDAAVCNALRIPGGTLQGKSKAWAVTHPRMVAIFLARKHTVATYGEIAKHFGVKTHSTAVAAEKKVRLWLLNDDSLSMGEKSWRARDIVERAERELRK